MGAGFPPETYSLVYVQDIRARKVQIQRRSLMLKKIVSFLSFMVVVSMLLTACGGATATDTPAATQPTATTGTAASGGQATGTTARQRRHYTAAPAQQEPLTQPGPLAAAPAQRQALPPRPTLSTSPRPVARPLPSCATSIPLLVLRPSTRNQRYLRAYDGL